MRFREQDHSHHEKAYECGAQLTTGDDIDHLCRKAGGSVRLHRDDEHQCECGLTWPNGLR